MGEMADYYLENDPWINGEEDEDYDDGNTCYREQFPNNIWRSKNGSLTQIDQLSNQYLLNIIKMLTRKNSIEALEAHCNQWDNLIEEANKRELDWK